MDGRDGITRLDQETKAPWLHWCFSGWSWSGHSKSPVVSSASATAGCRTWNSRYKVHFYILRCLCANFSIDNSSKSSGKVVKNPLIFCSSWTTQIFWPAWQPRTSWQCGKVGFSLTFGQYCPLAYNHTLTLLCRPPITAAQLSLQQAVCTPVIRYLHISSFTLWVWQCGFKSNLLLGDDCWFLCVCARVCVCNREKGSEAVCEWRRSNSK